MKKKWFIGGFIVLLILALILVILWKYTEDQDMTKEEKALSRMSVDEKIGQLFIVGIDGTELTEATKDLLSEYHIGNVIIFDRNIENKEQLTTLNSDITAFITEETGFAPIITVDTESANSGKLLEFTTDFPVQMAFSATGDEENAYTYGLYYGKELRALGFNMNLAPIADVNVNPENAVQGVDSFGDSPDQVAVFVTSYVKGLEENGVIAVAKSFPGTGDAREDEDTGLSMVYREKEFLRNQEMYPFVKTIANNIGAIMAGDAFFPTLDQESLPASLSPTIINKILRVELNYPNLVINSSLTNPLLIERYGIEKIAAQSIAAGINLMIAGTEEVTEEEAPYITAIAGIKTALANGSISEAQLDAAVLKIIERKLALEEEMTVPITDSTLEDHQTFASEISQKSITIQRDNLSLIPLNYKKTLFISPLSEKTLSKEEETEIEENATAAVLAAKLSSDYYVLKEDMDAADKQELAALAAEYEKVVILLENASIANGQYAMVNVLLVANPNLIVISDNPYDVLALPEMGTFVVSYEFSLNSMDSLFNILSGEETAKGTLPIDPFKESVDVP